jgi:hypothetical protein
MERYLAQTADQALEEMFSDRPLERRLNTCRFYFERGDVAKYVASLDAPARACFHEYQKITSDAPFPDQANALRALISAILEEFGRKYPA